MDFLQLVLGLVLLIAGAEALVRGASRLAASLGIPPLIVGLTVVALGTSAPEITVSVKAAAAGQTDVALGNAIGSNIANILLILGISALIRPLVVHQKLIRWDVPLMIGLSVLLWVFCLDGRLGYVDGLLLVAGLIGYIAFCVIDARFEPAEIAAQYEQKIQPPSARPPRWRYGAMAIAGLILLVFGSRFLVGAAVEIARRFGMSELVVGLTIVAAGTSLPEIAASVAASLRGERDIAVGNVIGSNIFNIVGALGLGVLASGGDIGISRVAMQFDIPVMIAASVACLPVFFTQGRIARWEGAMFLGYYILFTTYLVLYGTKHEELDTFIWIVASFLLPLTAVTLLLVLLRALHQSNRRNRHG